MCNFQNQKYVISYIKFKMVGCGVLLHFCFHKRHKGRKRASRSIWLIYFNCHVIKANYFPIDNKTEAYRMETLCQYWINERWNQKCLSDRPDKILKYLALKAVESTR